jgi:hypothetical protein
MVMIATCVCGVYQAGGARLLAMFMFTILFLFSGTVAMMGKPVIRYKIKEEMEKSIKEEYARRDT